MIFGIGTDIAQVSRFEKWVQNGDLLTRFFGVGEQYTGSLQKTSAVACQHYAARFAAKEAFAKALGTGFVGLSLKDFWVTNDAAGKPSFVFGAATQKLLFERVGACTVHLSLSHEKAYATAFVVIEKEGD